MSHNHPIYDEEKRFIINAVTKTVSIPEKDRPVLIQHDHNSEHITFECDRFVEGHDLMLCDKVEVHYNNIRDSRRSVKGVYPVADLRVADSDNSKITFTWVVSLNATTYNGPLWFAVAFSCTNEGDILYRWNTNICKDLTVSEGIDNGEAVEENYADVLEAWRLELFGIGDTEETRLLSAAQELYVALDRKGVEVLEKIPDDYQELYEHVDGLLDEVDERTLLDETYIEDVTNSFTLINSYLHNSGSVVENESGLTTKDAIECSPDDVYYITASSTSATACIVTYDENRLFANAYGHPNDAINGAILTDYKFVPLTNEKFVRFGSFDITYNGNPSLTIKKQHIMSASKKVEMVATQAEQYMASNYLYGKKYVACGDSFTEGDFTGYVDQNGLSGKNSPEIYDAERAMYKTYPWWIAERNGMTLVNEAKCGSGFTNISGANNPFSVGRYMAVPTDADYITLMFGLNEVGLSEAQIGTANDMTNTTLWGAYNIVFEHFLTNMPYAKIGVIIPDAWMNATYANAVKTICSYWGIPYLDLKNDTKSAYISGVPMGIYGNMSDTSPKARALRDAAFMVSDTNSHPNVKAHEYRSTVIENFLRSL